MIQQKFLQSQTLGWRHSINCTFTIIVAVERKFCSFLIGNEMLQPRSVTHYFSSQLIGQRQSHGPIQTMPGNLCFMFSSFFSIFFFPNEELVFIQWMSFYFLCISKNAAIVSICYPETCFSYLATHCEYSLMSNQFELYIIQHECTTIHLLNLLLIDIEKVYRLLLQQTEQQWTFFYIHLSVLELYSLKVSL